MPIMAYLMRLYFINNNLGGYHLLTNILLSFNNHKVPYDKSQLLILVSRLMNIQSPFSETIEIFLYKYNDCLTRWQIQFYTDFIKYL